MLLRQIVDPYLAQYAYLIGCQRTGEALIIDPERDIDRYRHIAAENGLRITTVTETHIHADFISGAQEFAADPNIKLYLSGEGGPDWSYKWPAHRPNTHFVKHGDKFTVGNIKIEVVHTPGHTPEHICFLITDVGGGADKPMALVTGDFLFVGDVGRPDLLESAAGIKNIMEPSARQLQSSLVHKLGSLADFIQVLPGHGAGSACGKSLGAVPVSTLGYERQFNKVFKLALDDAEEFVKDILSGQPEPPLYFATMKRVNRDGITVTDGVPVVPKLSPSEFTKLASGEGVRILDGRENRVEFVATHVPNSINAPLRAALFSAAAGSFINEEEKVLLVLNYDYDADLAVRQLYRIGIDNLLGWSLFSELNKAGLTTGKITRDTFSNLNLSEVAKEGEMIDVRTSAEYEMGHLTGAKSFPYTRLKTRLDELPHNRRLFVYCGTGRRAIAAASFLKSNGFDIVHLDGACAPAIGSCRIA